MERLCCAKCDKVVEYHEEVCLDMINSVMHKDCYALQYALKDFGTFRYIVDKYDFFITENHNLDSCKLLCHKIISFRQDCETKYTRYQKLWRFDFFQVA